MRGVSMPATIAIEQEDEGLAVVIIDQTLLPNQTKLLRLRAVAEVCEAIRSLRIRGAPAIGCAAAAGVALCASRAEARTQTAFMGQLEDSIAQLAATRPTAVNLFWALERMRKAIARHEQSSRAQLVDALTLEARKVIADDLARCHAIGRYGRQLIEPSSAVLTHCNAGALATAGYGTALGVIRAAHEAGRIRQVWVDETRPLLQGARLTAWELQQESIPCVVITDSMAASVMADRQVDAVIVGADRIAANGDVANKIGTYGLAILARYHQIPFYVAAPVNTIDYQLTAGSGIPIEQRGPAEITHLAEHATHPIVPIGVAIHNPAFDVTPHSLVSAIITDRGVAQPPYVETLAAYQELD
jgi:methylthioribose-1-phosphate isomerase